MSDRVILCRECGKGNKVTSAVGGAFTCYNCNAQVAAGSAPRRTRKERRIYIYAGMAAVGALIYASTFGETERKRDVAQLPSDSYSEGVSNFPKTTSPTHQPPAAGVPQREALPIPTARPITDADIVKVELVPVPVSPGVMQEPFGKKVAPLGIRTSHGSNYFVKLVQPSTGQTVMSMYVVGGRYFETEVPLGVYEMRYASGEHWYGPEKLFGPDTVYAKADSLFNFRSDGQQYLGYTVELIQQVNGNLGTSRLQPAQF